MLLTVREGADGMVEASRWRGRARPSFVGRLARAAAVLVVLSWLVSAAAHVWVSARVGIDTDLNLFLLLMGAFAVVGGVLMARLPTHPIGWLLAGAASLPSLALLGEAYAGFATANREPNALAVLGAWVNAWYWMPMLSLMLVFVPLLFPDGRLPTARWRPAVAAVAVCVAGMAVLGMLQRDLGSRSFDYALVNPIGLTSLPVAESSPLFAVFSLGFVAGIGLAIAAIVVRFRRTGGVERQQLKWFLAAAALLPLPILAEPLGEAGIVPAFVGGFLLVIVMAALPVAIGVAVLRYRLYDLDRLISRTLSYTIVTLILAALYTTTVLLLGGAIRRVTGADSALIVAASTLVAAVAFRPVRIRSSAPSTVGSTGRATTRSSR
jgi:hypothetical protein